MHIPKTGGITLRNIIDKQYAQEQIMKLPQKRKLAQVLNQPKRNFENLQCIYGHHRFGIHEHFQKPFSYITMLRHPVERIISTYFFILQNERNRMHEKVKNMTFEEFILSPDPNIQVPLSNHQTRFISGEKNPDFQKAQLNIKQHFSAIGITEMYNESLFIMKKKLGWNDISYTKKNITKIRSKKDDIPEDLLQVIKEKNELDIQLYDDAKAMLLKEIESLDQPSKNDLNEFIQHQAVKNV